MYVIGFNGPPHSGKDTIANGLAGLINQLHKNCKYERKALSMPMRLTAYSLLGERYSEQHYDKYKDVPQPLFNGESIRKMMIRLSEEFVKPIYGHEFWSRRMVANLLPDTGMVIISDIGFQAEQSYLEETFGAQNVLTVYMFRDGTDWSKDSRDYVDSQTNYTIDNRDGLQAMEAQSLLAHCINQLGWVF